MSALGYHTPFGSFIPSRLPYWLPKAPVPSLPYRQADTGLHDFIAAIAVPVADLVDGETFVLNDGVNPAVTFEFDIPPDGVSGGNVVVDVSGDTDESDVAVTMAAAINAQEVAGNLLLRATPNPPGNPAGTVFITHTKGGPQSIAFVNNVADEDFVLQQALENGPTPWMPARIGPWLVMLPARIVAAADAQGG